MFGTAGLADDRADEEAGAGESVVNGERAVLREPQN